MTPPHFSAAVYTTNCGNSAVNGRYNASIPDFRDATNSAGTGWGIYFSGAGYNLVDPFGANSYSEGGLNIFGVWSNTGFYASPAPTVIPYPLIQSISKPATLSSFWPPTGGKVSFQLAGWNNSASVSNVVIIRLGTSQIFSSTPTAGRGRQFSLSGSMNYDGTTNLFASVIYTTGDTNLPVITSSALVTNFNQTNISFTVGLDPSYDTNLVVTSGSISSQYGQAYASLVPPPPILLPFITVTNSSDVTLGNVQGLFGWTTITGTNYLILGVNSNAWNRVPLATW